jgi:hypothetical protein
MQSPVVYAGRLCIRQERTSASLHPDEHRLHDTASFYEARRSPRVVEDVRVGTDLRPARRRRPRQGTPYLRAAMAAIHFSKVRWVNSGHGLITGSWRTKPNASSMRGPRMAGV